MSESPGETSFRLHAIVHGRVQGVNFRYYTQLEAARLGLTGWVRNCWDDTVETVAEGPLPALKTFEHFLNRGPSTARVERVDVTYGEASGSFGGFSIRY
ncbi:MAG: acylphosphatase [Anaerolineae bacterium]|nr:acylphosphatase [Anaerolineae bacterium]